MRKLSASALSSYLRSPKSFYWSYIKSLAPIQPSVSNFDEAKIWGSLWAEFVDRFYKEVPEKENCKQVVADWLDQTQDWVPDKKRDALTKALESLSAQYYQTFNPQDGARTPEQSEMWVENDRFVGRLDGLSADGIVHEVKTTSKCPQLSSQLWKVEHSLQVRLYCVITDAQGYCVEFAFKDSPAQLFRGPVQYVTKEEKACWEQELNALADHIYALGEDPCNYPCHTDGCCLTTRYMVSMCPWETLCTMGHNEITGIAFKTKEHRK